MTTHPGNEASLTLPSNDPPPAEHLGLRRDVTVWGSYMWGYADVGAGSYAALGIVIITAGPSPISIRSGAWGQSP
jgi:hypothetical protein